MTFSEQCADISKGFSKISERFERLKMFLMASEHPQFPLSDWIAATPEEQEKFQLERWIAQQTGARDETN